MNSPGWDINMLRLCFLLTSVIWLAACSADQDAVSQSEQPAVYSQSAESDADMSGQELYELACGTCHDIGVDGAPVTGNPADWADRSPLWQAVLMEHAEEGFLDMPAKGGQEKFSDEEIDAAVLYMLGITFPERPAE